MKFIIDENIKGNLSFDLRDILQLIDKAENYKWILNDINLNYVKPTKQLNEILQEDFNFCEEIIDMKNIAIEYHILERIAKSNIQIIDGIILGNTTNKNIRIEIVDSSYWIIETNDNVMINNIKKRFH